MNQIKHFFLSIWQYRGFIYANTKREIESKYKNSLLGFAWAVINPLALIVIYTVIFSQLMKARLPEIPSEYGFSIYLCAGILTWGLFAEIVTRSQSMFLDNATLLKKVKLPKASMPITITLVACINFIIVFSLFCIFLLVSGHFPGLVILHLIPILLIQITFAVSLGLLLGVLNVYFRDIGQFFSIFLQFWFWLTPIIYPENILPKSIQNLLSTYNPLYSIIQAHQTVLVLHQIPDYISLKSTIIVTTILLILSTFLFKRSIGDIVDEL